MTEGKANPECRYCKGSGMVYDWVDYGSTSVQMPTECDCVEYPVFIEFLTETEGNDEGDVVEVTAEDDYFIYFVNAKDEEDYISKSLKDETFFYKDED